jgi:hypothetical protein
MSTTLDEILREARKLTPEERRERGHMPGGEVRQRRLEWLKAHRAEYGGQHLALDGASLVAAGRSYRKAKEKALSAGKANVFITYLPKLTKWRNGAAGDGLPTFFLTGS